MGLFCGAIPQFHPLRLRKIPDFMDSQNNCRRAWHTSTQAQAHCSATPVTSPNHAIDFSVALGFKQALTTTSFPDISPAAVFSSMQGLVIANLDPATAKVAVGITGPFLSAFGFLFILRIVMSWYPKLPVGKFPYVLAYAPTEPFLRVTRKVIPPLGGVDVTPVVWFGLVSFLNEILVGPQGLLVLLSQQVYK